MILWHGLVFPIVDSKLPLETRFILQPRRTVITISHGHGPSPPKRVTVRRGYITEEGILGLHRLIKNCPNLQSLHLTLMMENSAMTIAAWQVLLSNLPCHLQRLINPLLEPRRMNPNLVIFVLNHRHCVPITWELPFWELPLGEIAHASALVSLHYTCYSEASSDTLGCMRRCLQGCTNLPLDHGLDSKTSTILQELHLNFSGKVISESNNMLAFLNRRCPVEADTAAPDHLSAQHPQCKMILVTLHFENRLTRVTIWPRMRGVVNNAPATTFTTDWL